MRGNVGLRDNFQKQRLFTVLISAFLLAAFLALPLSVFAQRWAWGYNIKGQLGNNSTANSNVPVQINSALATAVGISNGYEHSIALESDGSVWTWGWDLYGQLGNGHDGEVYNSKIPVKISGLSGMIEVAAGGYHSMALAGGGTVKAWGFNNYGQLGDASTTQRDSPVSVSSLSGVTAIACGGYHSLAMKSNGTVWGWGNGSYGQVGNGANDISDSTPVQVSNLTGVTAIAAGFYHSLALKSNGTVWAWGRNNYGQLGDGLTGEGYDSNVPVQVVGPTSGTYLTGIIAIAAGGTGNVGEGSHSLALRSDGTVWAWGWNYYGQLGDGYSGASSDSNIPVQVSGLTGIEAIAAGGWHSLAITNTGSVKAWGYNGYGELGNGGNTDSDVPVLVSTINGMTHIAAGGYHSLAISCTVPGAPTITSATGDCNGVTLSWTAGSGCTTSCNVYRSPNTACPVGTLTKIAGPITATSYSDTTIAAGATRTYVVRGACDAYGTNESLNSNCMAATRLAVPAAPAAPAVADVDPCALSGVSISWSGVTFATGYDLRVDSTTVVTGVTSPYTYSPGNSSSHNYQVRSKNSCGSSGWSTATSGTDAICPVPSETSPGTGGAATGITWSSDKVTIGWQAVAGTVSGYRLYKGVPADLPNLLSASADSCTRYDGSSLSYALNTSTDVPSSGSFFWFLVDAYNGAGEGSAGNATAGARIVNSTGTCP